MRQWLHSLQFQMPAVALAAFIGILAFLLAVLHQMNTIDSQTRELGATAESGDLLATTISALSVTARERTKYSALGTEHHFRRFQISVEELDARWRQINTAGISGNLQSTESWLALQDKMSQYLILSRSSQAAGSGSRGGRQFRMDGSINDRLKVWEQEIREGFFALQDGMRTDRTAKLALLSASIEAAGSKVGYTLLLLVVMLAYVGVVLKWKILGPLKTLEKGAVELGTGNLGYQAFVPVENEIGRLASVFNKMSLQLQDHHASDGRLKRLEAINQIVRSVNHEINNPLMIISANAEFLAATLEGASDGVKSKLSSIMDEVQRIHTVTQRLKEIREPVTENYIDEKDQMIDIVRSSGIWERTWEKE